MLLSPSIMDAAGGTSPSKGMRRLVDFLQILLVVTVVLPFAVFGIFAWVTYHLAFGEAEQLVQKTVDILHEHTLKVFETQELILDQIAELIPGLGWDEIGRSPRISAALARLEKGRSQIAAIWLVDANGDVRASSRSFPAGLNGADRDYFQMHVKGDVGTYIGKAYEGRVTGKPSFGFSRRRETSDGMFDGIISISVSSDYFSTFFHSVAPEADHLVALVRTDGELLARSPSVSEEGPVPPDDPFMRAIALADEGLMWRVSRRDGIERLYGYRRVNAYPVVVSVAMTRSSALQPWTHDLIIYGSIIGAFGLALVLFTLFALRRARSEDRGLLLLATEARQRAQVEAQLHQSQKLEALGQLTGGIAHDFNNLLTAIIGNLELLRDQLKGRNALDRANNALSVAVRGERLVQLLLAFSRRQPLTVRVLDVNTIIRDMDALFRQALGSDINFTLSLSPDLWSVEADASQTEMALLNLVVNARDAMPEGGTLRIETANVTLHDECDGLSGEFAAVTVSDTGTGMSAEVLAHVFEPFFTTKPPGKGTGLGLASVYGFVKQCRGGTTIRSDLGQGTAVTIYLPRGS